jgi:hypothetical protein
MNFTLSRIAALAVLPLLTLTVPSLASSLDLRPNPWEISLSPGMAVPLDVYGSILHDDSFALQGSVLAPINSWMSAGLEVGHAFKHQGSYGLEYSTLHVTPVIEFGAWRTLGAMALKPYVAFGGGLYNVTAEMSDPVLDSLGLDLKETESYGGFNYGAGVLFKLTDSLAFGPEVRHHTVFISDAPDYQYFTGGARLALLF